MSSQDSQRFEPLALNANSNAINWKGYQIPASIGSSPIPFSSKPMTEVSWVCWTGSAMAARQICHRYTCFSVKASEKAKNMYMLNTYWV
jgi:hypothetical protein